MLAHEACAILAARRYEDVRNNDGGQERLEILLVLFLAFVVLVALLTILGPQIEDLVQRTTGR